MAKQMLRQLALISCAGCGACILPLLPLYLLSAQGLINLAQVVDVMLSLEVVLSFSLISLLFFLKFNRD